ncbi:Mitotic exit network component [Tulasnella sp. 403]|nr:Mitotic exit network component [Tulasnella sp. 403]
MSSFFGIGKTRTFKPRRDVPEGSKQYALRKYAEATLGSGNLRAAVVLPEGEDLNEWLAVHTVDFFNHLNMLYGTVTEFCGQQEYLWEDGVTYKRPTKLPAPVYIDNLMNWVQGLLDDENVFPSKIAHLNTSYRHFFLFINEFDLVDKKELVPLEELNDAILMENDVPNANNGANAPKAR